MHTHTDIQAHTHTQTDKGAHTETYKRAHTETYKHTHTSPKVFMSCQNQTRTRASVEEYLMVERNGEIERTDAQTVNV